ncbi:MAG: hypothetical protein ACE5G5_03085 [Candidatus Methylomirabilales bacterium]
MKHRQITYCVVASRFAYLRPEVDAVLRTLSEVQVITDRRVRERRRAHRPVSTDRRKGTDRRLG